MNALQCSSRPRIWAFDAADGKQLASHPLAWQSWELLVHTDSQQSGGNIADGSGGAMCFPSGDMARLIPFVWLQTPLNNINDAVVVRCLSLAQYLR